MAFYFDRQGNLRLEELDQLPWLVHGFSTRAAGHLSLPDPQRRFLQTLGGDAMQLATLRQIHSAHVHVVGPDHDSSRRGDALIAPDPNVLVGVKTADCLPILVADPNQRIVAAIHAGWRGLARRVVEKTIGEMRRWFGCDPDSLLAAIGPGIQACCFEVGPEVLEEFSCQFVDAAEFCRRDPPNPALTMLPRQTLTGPHTLMRNLESDRGRVDLAEAARRQLLAAGLPAAQLYNCALCTACDVERFYSYRREKQAAGRMLSVIGARRAAT